MESGTLIEFRGVDIVVERQVDDVRVRLALAQSLLVSEHRVAMIGEIENYPERRTADVVCVASPVEGDFSRILSIQTERLTLPYDTTVELVQRLGRILQTRCLVPNEGLDPYVMWLVSPDGSSERVELDVAAFDEDRYILSLS